jgi:hypothetical protein
MLEFYRDNIKYSLKILYYKYLLFLVAVAFPVSVITVGGLLVLSKFDRDLFNIVLFCTVSALFFLGLVLLLGFIANFIFMTGYSFLKNEQEEEKIIGIWFEIGKTLTNWKFILIALALSFAAVTVGSLLYRYVLPDIDLYNLMKLTLVVEIKLVITAIILVGIIKRGSIWRSIIHIIKTIYGILQKTLLIVLLLLASAILVGIIYWVVSLIFDPILYPLFGIAG